MAPFVMGFVWVVGTTFIMSILYHAVMILAIYYAPATNVLLHKSNILCIVNRTVLDGCIWGVTLDIHLGIERRYDDHEGLGCDGSHRTDV